MVMGDDSCSRGCGFDSRRRILDGHDIFSQCDQYVQRTQRCLRAKTNALKVALKFRAGALV